MTTTTLSTLNDGEKTASLVDRVDHKRNLLILRGIEAGTGLKLEVLDSDGHPTSPQHKLRLSVFGAFQAADGTNIGVGHDVYAGFQEGYLRFRRVRGQNGITVNVVNDTIVVSGNGSLTDLVQDTTPQLGGDLDLNGHRLVTAAGDIVLEPASGRTVLAGVVHTAVLERPLESGAITDDFAVLTATDYRVAFVDYRIERGTAIRAGTLTVVHNGTTVEYSDAGTGIGDAGVALSAALIGDLLLLKYTTTVNAATGVLTCSIRGW